MDKIDPFLVVHATLKRLPDVQICGKLVIFSAQQVALVLKIRWRCQAFNLVEFSVSYIHFGGKIYGSWMCHTSSMGMQLGHRPPVGHSMQKTRVEWYQGGPSSIRECGERRLRDIWSGLGVFRVFCFGGHGQKRPISGGSCYFDRLPDVQICGKTRDFFSPEGSPCCKNLLEMPTIQFG